MRYRKIPAADLTLSEIGFGCGGNAGLIGWQLVGYPGPQMSYRNEIDKHFGQPFRLKPRSLEQITGKKADPWEDEKG